MYKVSEQLVEIDTSSMSNIYRDEVYYLFSSPNWGPQHEICFTVIKHYNSNNEDNHKFCRLSMMEPKYIGAEGEDLILSKEDIDKIISILTSNNYIRPEFNTNWDYMIYHMNWEHQWDEEADMDCGWVNLPADLPIPDYYKLLG